MQANFIGGAKCIVAHPTKILQRPSMSHATTKPRPTAAAAEASLPAAALGRCHDNF